MAFIAKHPGACACCDELFPIGTPLVKRKGKWIIAAHAPGGDDA